MQIKITIGGVDRTSYVETRSFRKEDNINNAVDTLSFTIPKSAAVVFEPTVNSEVIVEDLDTSIKIFGGHISDVDRRLSGLLLEYDITCVDYTAELDRLLVFERFEDISTQEIITTIIEDYAPNFTTNHVDAGDFVISQSYDENIQIGDNDEQPVIKYVTEGPYHYGAVTGGNTLGRWGYSQWG